MRLHLYFGKADAILVQWATAPCDIRLSVRIQMIFEAEMQGKIAKLPEFPSFDPSKEVDAYEPVISISNVMVEQYILSIPARRRNATIKHIVYKHVAMNQSGIVYFAGAVPIAPPSVEKPAQPVVTQPIASLKIHSSGEKPKKVREQPPTTMKTVPQQNTTEPKHESAKEEKSDSAPMSFLESALLSIAGD